MSPQPQYGSGLLGSYALGQDFGQLSTIFTGTATDPNSAPLLILFLLPIFFTTTNRTDMRHL